MSKEINLDKLESGKTENKSPRKEHEEFNNECVTNCFDIFCTRGIKDSKRRVQIRNRLIHFFNWIFRIIFVYIFSSGIANIVLGSLIINDDKLCHQKTSFGTILLVIGVFKVVGMISGCIESRFDSGKSPLCFTILTQVGMWGTVFTHIGLLIVAFDKGDKYDCPSGYVLYSKIQALFEHSLVVLIIITYSIYKCVE